MTGCFKNIFPPATTVNKYTKKVAQSQFHCNKVNTFHLNFEIQIRVCIFVVDNQAMVQG